MNRRDVDRARKCLQKYGRNAKIYGHIGNRTLPYYREESAK